ncbi:MAG: EF-hand domain-containing protein [Hyphomonadaceae bacterium]
MKLRLAAVAVLALAAGAASAQPPVGGHPGPGGHGPGGFGLLQFDTNADGKLTKSEFDAALRARFDKIDANKDGSATREEFQAFRKTEMEAHKAARAKERFAELDKDKNGQLSQAEFVAGVPDHDQHGFHGGDGPRPPMGGPPPRFMADAGPRGFGPEGRFKPGGPDQKPDAGPKRAGPLDADADGKVNFAEFSAGPLAAFARADANKDGTVTIAELQALHGGGR